MRAGCRDAIGQLADAGDDCGKPGRYPRACAGGSRSWPATQLAPLRALGPVNDTITTVPMPALSHLHMDPEQPVPGAADGMLVGSLPTEAVDAFINAAGPSAAFPLLTAEIRHLGGELARPRPGNGALACLNAGYVLHAASPTPVPELADPGTADPDDQGRAGALGRLADVPQLRRNPAPRSAVLDQARLPAATPDQGQRGPR